MLKTTTCWIAPEDALQHARSKLPLVSEVFYRWKIQESEYVVQAGFDESLIKSGVGYLQQIHVFVSAEVDATSPLFSELGKIFSPFSSILFTESSLYYLPVFKDDGNVWEFDELIYFTASKFADDGSSAVMPPTVISFSQNPHLADGPTAFSQDGSGNGEGKKQRPNKGKERDRGDEDKADEQGKSNKDPGGDGEKPPGDGTISGSPKISFCIVSKINPIQDRQKAFQIPVQDRPLADFQTLTLKGALTIQVPFYSCQIVALRPN